MIRVCDAKGRVVIADKVSSEDQAKSEYHNEIERLFDASHVKAYRLSELQDMMLMSGLQDIKATSWSNIFSFDEWKRISGVKPEAAAKLQVMLLKSIDGDKAGLQVEMCEGSLLLKYTTAILEGRREK